MSYNILGDPGVDNSTKLELICQGSLMHPLMILEYIRVWLHRSELYYI